MPAALRALAAAAAATALLVAAGPASAALVNPADELGSLPLDPLRADPTVACTHADQPGAQRLAFWVAANAGTGEFWGIESCRDVRGGSTLSLHAEGRAVDWKLDSRDPVERKVGDRLVSLLIRGDRKGRRNALARRMGLQEVIWNCRIWTPRAPQMRFYSPCARARIDDTTAHRNHVHLGMNRAGAALKTTFWTNDSPALDVPLIGV